jgi:hypothetical protein
VANGTVGPDIAIRAAGLSGEIIVPSFTFMATFHVILWQGLTRSSAMSIRRPSISPERVEALITRRVTGIIGVHIWGRESAVDELDDIARRHGLTLAIAAFIKNSPFDIIVYSNTCHSPVRVFQLFNRRTRRFIFAPGFCGWGLFSSV